MSRKLGPIITLAKAQGKHNDCPKTGGAGVILRSLLPQSDKQFSVTVLSPRTYFATLSLFRSQLSSRAII